MTFTFTPKTEEEIQRDGLLEAGNYDFEIVSAEAAISKTSGKPMIVIELKVFESDTEHFRKMTDYLSEGWASKFRNAMIATGLEEVYKSGELDPQLLVGKSGKLLIEVSGPTATYSKHSNKIKDYITTDVIAQSVGDLDDEIKF